MRLAREGRVEMAVATVILAAAGVASWLWFWPGLVVCAVVWVWTISFFRDPVRVTVCRPGELCSPADGTVTEVARLDHDPNLGGPALKIGVFLSIFNVHVNRSPCAGRVMKRVYTKGSFLDARHPESGHRNEANTLWLDSEKPLQGPVIVRQVAGRIARRIVCHANPGATLRAGQRFGMIKFGSRTELILPGDVSEPMVRVGQKVKGGVTIVARQVHVAEVGSMASPVTPDLPGEGMSA